jgi:hypothetical protein
MKHYKYLLAIVLGASLAAFHISSKSPTTLQGFKKPKMVSSGETHTCAIDDEGVKCWGNNDPGRPTPIH